MSSFILNGTQREAERLGEIDGTTSLEKNWDGILHHLINKLLDICIDF